MSRAFAALALAGSLVSCSSSSGGGGGSKLVTQTGRVITYIECAPMATAADPDPAVTVVAGATVTVGANSTTTAKDGTYTLQVPADEPFVMNVTDAPNYVPLLEEQNTVTANYDRGDTQLIPSQTAEFLSDLLPSYDTSLGLITFQLVGTGTCTDLGGSTVTVTGAGSGALTQYPQACTSPTEVAGEAYVTNGIFPAAVVYNVTPGTQTVSAASPKCTQIPFPYTDPTMGLTYDGTVETQGVLGASFVKIFMK
jgi:hypothetical protein